MKVTLFHDFHSPVEDKEFIAILRDIKSNKFEERIKSIRYAYHKGLDSKGDKLKKELPAFTPSATFTNRRKLEFLTEYSGIAHLDLDNISVSELQEVRTKVDSCGYTFASFISPSGMGIKIFIRINSSLSDHQQMILQLMHYYQELTGCEPDAKCKDVTRLCFVSWDEEMYLNEESEIFRPVLANQEKLPSEKGITPYNLDYCIEFTEKISTYQKGNRNSHIYLLARNANRLGIPKEVVLEYCVSAFDLDSREKKAAVESAFKNNQSEFAKFAKLAKDAKVKIEESKEMDWSKDLLFNTPKIPLSVHTSLPQILKEGSAAFDIHREKDVFLTSALVILSGCLPNVKGLYSQRTVYPNLFCFILAPPASGKGSMQSSKELADVYHNKILNESKELKLIYERELRDYKRKTSVLNAKSSAHLDLDPPVEPPFKVVYIPANTSTAKLYLHLQHNDEQGIICETEADTLGAVFKNEWGSYSDLLRKSFHHEKVSLSRKSNSEFVDINHPRISVALTGTPNQIFNIIPNAEDGLFSRFIFYAFRSDANWVSPAPDPFRVNLTEHFKDLGERVYQMVQFLEQHPTEVHLTTKQWNRLNNEFKDYLKDITEFAGEEATSVIKRMGLILYRICMVFTAIRKFENGECENEIYCSDDDFENAFQLVEIYIQHSILMFTNLPNQSAQHSVQNPPKKQKFYDALPDSFQRKEAVDIGLSHGIKTRSVDYCLEKWEGKLIQKLDVGVYVKLTEK